MKNHLGWLHFCTGMGITILLLWAGSISGFSLATEIRIASYLIFLNIAVSILIHFSNKKQPTQTIPQTLWSGWKWVTYWHALVLIAGLIGGSIGALLFTSIGGIFDIGDSFQQRLFNGFYDGAFYFLIWAPGGAIVALILWANKKHPQQR